MASGQQRATCPTCWAILLLRSGMTRRSRATGHSGGQGEAASGLRRLPQGFGVASGRGCGQVAAQGAAVARVVKDFGGEGVQAGKEGEDSGGDQRSEERRGGKEGRSRGSP